MDKETVKRLAKENGIDIEQDTLCRFVGWSEPMIAFAQACCDWQKEKDAQICETLELAEPSGLSRIEQLRIYTCLQKSADAIRNAKS